MYLQVGKKLNVNIINNREISSDEEVEIATLENWIISTDNLLL